MPPSRTLEAEIGRLYQLPVDEFTSARNALAKKAGSEASRVRSLVKPSVPAWAVNQLYWRERGAWDALVAASENARKVNRAVLAGKSGDVRAANTVHDEAVEAALKTTLALLDRSGVPVTDLTRHTIATTLRALPGEEAPGRLTKPVQPGGFEALAGVAVAPGARRAAFAAATESRSQTTIPQESSAAARKRVREQQAEAASARDLKDAETAARHEEFEKARLERDARRAQDIVEKAREAMNRATADLELAEREAREAAAASRAAVQRARKAHDALERLKNR